MGVFVRINTSQSYTQQRLDKRAPSADVERIPAEPYAISIINGIDGVPHVHVRNRPITSMWGRQ